MIRLTLRTLLAYLDDTLPPADAKIIGQKLAESTAAQELAERIKKVTRKRSLSTPAAGPDRSAADPNTVASYLSDQLNPEQVADFEKIVLESDVQLAELAACHQILTMLLSEQVRVPPAAYRRMYGLVKGKESIPTRKPNRNFLPVGGVTTPANARDAEADDAALLLGLPAYSRSGSPGKRAFQLTLVGLFAIGFAVSTFLLWPKGNPFPNLPEVAKATPTEKTPDTQPTPTTGKKVELEPDPISKPETEPVKEPAPMPKPPVELAPKSPGPKLDRALLGTNESPNSKVLLVRKADSTEWVRAKKGAELTSTDRLMALPGYRTKVQFDKGLAAELWGNVPTDLVPVPVFETAITPYVPGEEADVDLAVHVGRVYFTSTRKTPLKVRLRFGEEIWLATLPDTNAEFALEIQQNLIPGAIGDAPQTSAQVHVLKGTIDLAIREKTFAKIPAGEAMLWNSIRGKTDGPSKPGEKFGKDSAYFSQVPIYPDKNAAQAMLTALDEFAEAEKGDRAMSAAISELRSEPTGAVTPAYLAGSRFSIFASGAVGDLPSLADSLNDSVRSDLRSVAVAATLNLLASNPDRIAPFRKLARDKLRLTAEGVDSLLQNFAGFSEAQKANPEFLSKVIEQLNAPEIVQREVALFVLIRTFEPNGIPEKSPLVFDVSEASEKRETAIKAWKKRIETPTLEKK